MRTIILLVRHGDEGSFGLVLNRPLDITVKEACEKILEMECSADGPIYQGGPCEGPLMVLHNRKISEELAVAPGVYFTTERHEIESLLEANEGKTRYFANYSGWGPGQLEAEIESGSWISADADESRIFDNQDEQWFRLMAEVMLGQKIRPAQMPEDPSMN